MRDVGVLLDALAQVLGQEERSGDSEDLSPDEREYIERLSARLQGLVFSMPGSASPVSDERA